MKKSLLLSAALLALVMSLLMPGTADAQTTTLVNAKVKAYKSTYVPLTSYTYGYGPSIYYSYCVGFYLPFDFYFDNYNMRYVTMSGSGGLRLAPSSTSSFYKYVYAHPDYLHYSNYYRYSAAFLYPFWGCHYYNFNSTSDYYMYVYYSGNAPNRVAIFEWRNAAWYYARYTYGVSLNFQVKLYESSNTVEYCYGTMDRGSCTVGSSYNNYTYYYYTGLVGFSGYNPTASNYINIDPNGNGNCGYNKWEFGKPLSPLSKGWSYNETVYNNEQFDAIKSGDVIQLSYAVDVTESYPTKEAALRKGYIYGDGTMDPSGYGDDQHPSIKLDGASGFATVRRQISGPFSYPTHPNFRIIYDATNSIPDKALTKFTTKTPTAGANDNYAFGTAVSGSLDLKTNETLISGGYYHLYDVITNSGRVTNNEYYFNIAAPWDLQVSKVVNPKTRDSYMYSLSSAVPVRVNITNKGINNLTTYYAIARITNSDGDEVYRDSVYWEAKTPSEQITLGEEVGIDFDSWSATTSGSGDYTFTAYVYLANDVENWNNYWPWQILSTEHIFRVAPEFDAQALMVLEPADVSETSVEQTYYVGRPVAPRIRYQNNGISDISDAYSNVVIKILGTDTEVYNKQNIKVSSIPAGLLMNTTDHIYDNFVPAVPGKYEIIATISASDDEINDNDIVKDTFTVVPALSGTYKIGPKQNTGDNYADSVYNSRNFETIIEAADALFERGVAGAVVFEFTASSYNVGDTGLEGIGPALDLRSKIAGMSAANTVTFRPASNLMAAEGSVTVNLYSPSGVGIIFGQSLQVINPNAIINNIASSLRKNYAGSNGYFIFDGGSQRALKFVLHTNSEWNAVFYLSQGASNITIKNSVITSNNPTASWNDYTLPVAQFVQPTFLFEKDWRTVSSVRTSYSAGVAMRSIPPMDDIDMWSIGDNNQVTTNSKSLDTLNNANNLIQNNKISGFSYGVVSMGIGTLFNVGKGKYVRYYNNSNTLTGNLIYNVSRAGIFMGNEENSTIKYNRILSVATTTTGYNAGTNVGGIMLGGERNQLSKLGYATANMTVDGNEISNVGQAASTAKAYVYGINVEQVETEFGNQQFPDTDENILIMNNVVWGLRSGSASVNKVGVRLSTERLFGESDMVTKLVTPEVSSYFTKGDRVVNNTMILSDDGFANTLGIYTAVLLQNNIAPVVMNNAIAMKDNNGAGNTNIYAAVCYQGLSPWAAGGINSDRNVYYLNQDTDSPALFRYLAINESSRILYEGTRMEYATLNQWQNYSHEDALSRIYDFTSELTNTDMTDINSKLRIKSTPTYPQGSLMNNRGENLNYVLKDIDGNNRGVMNQRYDIGAFEFPGVMLTTDVEVTSFGEPSAYLSSDAPYNDAEHIMTTSPVDVKVKLTNNGSLSQTGLKVNCKIYRETPTGTFYDSAEVDINKLVNIDPAETIELSFDLGDGTGAEFKPFSYSEWNMFYKDTDEELDSTYTIPAKYKLMEYNITPLYRIIISVQSDENISNNVLNKTVRFYLKRSMYNIMVSAENTYQDISAETNDVKSGHRNFDSLVAGLARLGWVNGWNTLEEYPVLNVTYDVLDRTAWEPRAVNYSMYRTLIWSDGDDKALTRQQREDLTKFAESGTADVKKNLVVSSQEMLRENYDEDSAWVKNTLFARLNSSYPTDPNGGAAYAAQDNALYYITGQTVGKDLQHSILRTDLTPTDPDPIPALMSIYTESQGLTRVAYSYNAVISPTPVEKSAGAATVAIALNTVYLGIDWRHYGNIEFVLRAVLDFLNKYNGQVIPVELSKFEARTSGNSVILTWETASEINSSKFEIERSTVTAAGRTSFTRIGEEQAAGKSSTAVMYGPVVDNRVISGETYIYRLKMIDLDGKYDYSNEVQVTIGDGGSLWLGEAVPNPAGYATTLSYSLTGNSTVELSLYDLSGKKVMAIENGAMSEGVHSRTLDLSGLPAGYYSVVLNVNGKAFVKQLHIVK